jgi:hypothetical protein
MLDWLVSTHQSFSFITLLTFLTSSTSDLQGRVRQEVFGGDGEVVRGRGPTTRQRTRRPGISGVHVIKLFFYLRR